MKLWTHSIRRRMIVFSAAIVTMAAIGAFGGYSIIRETAIHQTRSRLQVYASRLRTRGEVSSAESRGVLGHMNASPGPDCSEQELAYFRDLLFRSEFIKDLARVSNGSLVCSAVHGRFASPVPLTHTSFQQPDGTKVFRNISPFQLDDLEVISLQLDRSLLVFSPYTLLHMEPTSFHLAITVPDIFRNTAGGAPQDLAEIAGHIVGRDSDGIAGHTLYATRCSARYFDCVTAYVGIEEALTTDHAIFRGYELLSGLAGALLGLAGALLFNRDISMKNQLRRAVRKGQLRVLYQPIVDLKSRRIASAEALVRWIGDDGVEVSPSVFVRVAEECGFVGVITQLVLKRGMNDLGEILKSRPAFRLNVNISAFDLSDSAFQASLASTLLAAGIPASQIGIELTESSTTNRSVAVAAIFELRAKGHCFFIDDFGTGYSSLSYLVDLAVDGIKIDRSFTKAIGTDAVTVTILPQILAIAQSLKLQVIIEGIENDFQADYFNSVEGRVMGQGWLFGHPMSATEFMQVLSDETKNNLAQGAMVP